MVTIDPHPLFDASVFATTFPRPLAELSSTPEIATLLTSADLASTDAEAPLHADDGVRAAVRDLLRHGGYKPTGRGKPSSEYLARAVGEGALAAINLAVDACNAVSLHSGLPISVVDLDRARAPLSIRIAPTGARYVFNLSGQEIDLGGLLCLFDADGPCANGVKDAQRTKTHAGTVRTLSVIWAPSSLAGRSHAAATWYRSILSRAGATTSDVA